MKNVNRQTPRPLNVPRTRRNHNITVLTSLPAGKCVPVAAIPMLREDNLNARVRIAVEMQETVELLMNPVFCRVTAYVVPWLAFERFEGSRDQFDRSYMGEPQVEGGDVVPFFETAAMGTHGSNAVYKALGLHAAETAQVNTGYLEAYNVIWNFRAKNRSLKLMDTSKRTRLQSDLAPAFWPSSRFEYVVPDVDLAIVDGEVPLNLVNPVIPIKGIGIGSGTQTANGGTLRESDGSIHGVPRSDPTNNPVMVQVKGTSPNLLPDITAELTADGITVSLSNIELARKTQAFARLRERYDGYDDEWIIDMLMSGLTIPDQALKQPVLIADKMVRFAQAKRYATDAGNLAESAVSGAAMLDVSLRVPQLNTGGIVMVMVECLPEQLFERQADPFFHAADVAALPEWLRDELDPEKVVIIKNGQIDTDHSTPDSTFGYAPLNWPWTSFGPRIGGKFYRPEVDAGTDQERQRLWAVENIDPKLGEEFYLVTDLHTKPFLDTESDPFEATVVGNAVIGGHTVFGAKLVEANGNYDAVMAKAPTERIVKES